MWGIVLIYFAFTIGLGFLAARRLKDSNDSEGYFLGGKSFGPLFSAFKYATTFESGSSMISTTGLTYSAGMVGYLQQYCLSWAYFFSLRTYGPRIKVACDHFNTITIPQILEKRYRSKVLRIVCAISLVISMGGTMVAQLKAMAETFSVTLNIEYVPALLIGVVVVGIYSVVGGYTASVWTDLIQGLIMLVGVILLNYYAQLSAFGQYMPFWEMFPALYEYIDEFNPAMLTITGGGIVGITTIVVYAIINFYSGMALPQQSVVLFSMKNVKVMKTTLGILLIFSVLLLWNAGPSAMMAHIVLDQTFSNPDAVIPTLTLAVMPKWAAGIFIAAILSAIMSTVDGVVLIASSAISQDILNIVMHEKYRERPVFYDRIATLGVTIVALLVAIKPPTIVFFIMAFSFAMSVFTFLMPMFGVTYIKSANKFGALAAALTGTIVLPVWTVIGEPGIPAMFLGLIASPIMFFIFNTIGKSKCDDSEITSPLFEKYAAIKW